MSFEASLIDELRRVHGVHTIILYGSRARGEATAESDIDIASYADVASASRDSRLWSGMFLDAFIYPSGRLDEAPDADVLKLCDGRVLLDERSLAEPYLARVAALEEQGPPALTEAEQRMRRVWIRKMLARIRRGDIEAQYRHHWLLYQMLEDYFALRGQWYRGPKRALGDLLIIEPHAFVAFERALAPGAPLDTLEALAEIVTGEA
jgi:predicted nucleotidyltransferase